MSDIQWENRENGVNWEDEFPDIDPYEVLQVPLCASDETIKSAYRTLVRRFHPDRVLAAEGPEAEAMIRKVNRAFEMLSDPETRRAVDRFRWNAGQ